MGALQSLPGIGEVVTAIDSSVKIIVAGCCALGELIARKPNNLKNTAKKFLKDAGNSWVEYSERSVIAAPVRAIIHNIAGNEAEGKRVMQKMVESTLQVIDSIPVVGHVKGVVHYAMGQKERGHDSMKSASRAVAVVVAGAVTGGFGGGLVLGGTAACASGLFYDVGVSAIEKKPYGVKESGIRVYRSCKKKDVYSTINSIKDLGYSVFGDFIAGAAGVKGIKELNKAPKQRNDLTTKIGKEATKDVVDAGKKLHEVMKKVKGDSHVCTKAKNLDTGKEVYGFNARCRKELRIEEFTSKGADSRYTSKTNAKNGHSNEFPGKEGILEKTAKEMQMDFTEKVPKRSVRACAEHQALEKLDTHGAKAKIRTVTVRSTKGRKTAIERCDNCMQFDPLMGDVPTDGIHGMPVPTQQFVLDGSMPAVKGAAIDMMCPYAIHDESSLFPLDLEGLLGQGYWMYD